MSDLTKTLQDFRSYLDRILAIRNVQGLSHYDLETDMPEGAKDAWRRKFNIVGAEVFKMSTSEELGGYIKELSAHEDELGEVDAALLRYVRRDYEKQTKVPAEFSMEQRAATAEADAVWRKAKNSGDFALFAPYLDKNFELAKRYALYIEPDKDPFDTLLDKSEPGMTSDVLDKYFAKLRERIVPLLKRITESKKKINTDILSRKVPIETQRKISDFMMHAIGYDLSRGEIRETEHPFSSSFGKHDCRITTHYYENRFISSVFSVLHECGHAMYEQNKDDSIADTMLDKGASAAIHEGQSRFYENSVGRSREFLGFVFDGLSALLGPDFADMTPDMLFEAANAAAPGLIRIEADELTYSLHIMIRYEIERMMLAGEVTAKDLPSLWNGKIKDYLGLDVPNDSLGVLQDVHWGEGLIGYFPSYSLGSAYGAQLLHAMNKDLNVSAELKKGNVPAISNWLKDKLHKYGSMYLPQELLVRATGEEFNPDYYVSYLEEKFTKLYEL